LKAAELSQDSGAVDTARRSLHRNRSEHFNQVLDAVVAGIFMVLVLWIVLLSIREWILLLARKRLALLHEAKPVWLPEYANLESRPIHLFSLLALAFALARELSGEAQVDRLRQTPALCECEHDRRPAPTGSAGERKQEATRAYLTMTERRFDGVTRCC
jgi:hypothetical protein